MSSSFEKSVKGGTKIKLAPPKSKYVEHILLATRSGEAGVAEVFRTLRDRLRDSTWTIVFKSLIIVHLMIKEGDKDVTLLYLSASPKRNLAINTFTDVQTQGQNIRLYSNYLVQRAQSYGDTHVDYVRSGIGRMKNLSIDKGLLRETESIQAQIRALLKCNLLDNEPENEISLMAFRLLTKDLLDLFAVMNEAVMNVLSHYFELSKTDAEHAIGIYKTFAKQTDHVVQYLSIARQYEHVTKLEIPKIKHAPTSLAASLQEYIDDNDFEVNRRQYLAEKQAKSGNKFSSNDTSSRTFSTSKPSQSGTKAAEAGFPEADAFGAAAAPAKPSTTQPATKAPAPDMIDFFGSIEQNQEPMSQASAQQYAQPPGLADPQIYSQQTMNGPMPNGQVSTNPFGQPQQAQYQPQQIQPSFTGAGFGGFGPQPQQQPQQQAIYSLNPFPEPMQQQQNFQQTQQAPYVAPQPESQLQPQQQTQPQSSNPFRQSMMMTGQMTGYQAPQLQQQQQQQSTNPFARSAPQQNPMQTGQYAAPQPAQLQPQPTGTNPFARAPKPQQSGPTANFITPAVTGSTNPFRQSAFVNQQTGLGWQNSTPQGSMGGWEQMETMPVFPRPGQ